MNLPGPLGGQPGWTVACVVCWALAGTSCLLWSPPVVDAVLSMAACLALAARLGPERFTRQRRRVSPRRMAQLPAKRLLQRSRRYPDVVYLGRGFLWLPEHAARLMALRRPAKGLSAASLSGTGTRGAPAWMHGLGQGEADIEVPLRAMEGNTLVYGTTGAGKTRLFELLIAQAVARDDVVFVFDPKADRGLCEATRRACQLAGRGRDFLYFHPGFPERSVRLDPLRNWSRVGSIASRISALLPAERGGSAFVHFGWRALNAVAAALVYVDERPSLLQLRRYVEGGATPLLARALEEYFRRLPPGCASGAETEPLAQSTAGSEPRHAARLGPRLSSLVARYERQPRRAEEIDGLLSMVLHDQVHFSKMIQNVLPLLATLTHGELGALLSPDAADAADPRPVFDAAKVIEARKVLYLGLDCLSDATTGSAMGSILLADLACVAGDIYNYGIPGERRVQLFVDEAAECVNAPLIQLLNKGRGAGFQATLAVQTWADLVARLGSEAQARMIPGNCNNLIALRVRDRQTQELVSEAFGETLLPTLGRTRSASTSAAGGLAGISAGSAERLDDRVQALVPPEVLGSLPDFEYMALLRGGEAMKGRFPVMEYGE